MRDFDIWMNTFEKSISSYKWFTDFEKAYNNTIKIKIGLNLLNSLIGSINIENDFRELLKKYEKEILPCIPMLIAKRVNELKVIDYDGEHIYNFKKINYSIEQYIFFMKETGIFDLLKNHIINNLIDYMFGVEVGLDSNSRKNRTGDSMEALVEYYIIKAGYINNNNYYKQIKTSFIKDKFGIDLMFINEINKAEKQFDFLLIKNNYFYAIEVNFYHSVGSKLNETAKSYTLIKEKTKNIKNFDFIWITDGAGWFSKSHRDNLHNAFNVIDRLYNINDLKNGVLEKL